jgi:hypothetical protein
MTPWVDPNESRSETWNAGRDAAIPEKIRPTVERAHGVELPFQYRERRSHQGNLGGVVVDDVEYTSGNFVVNGGVTADRGLKLHFRGVMWRSGEYDDARRFKLQIRREPPVTDTVPFGEYEVWQRYQLGSVEVDEVDGPTFTPSGDPETRRPTASFDDLLEPVKHRLSELELIRNPSFAKYRLAERGEWAEYGGVFRWKANAFKERVN